MTYFDRFDICEAWYLWLPLVSSDGADAEGFRNYQRFCKLTKSFEPRPSLDRCNDLSTNGLEIYLNLLARFEGKEPLPFVDVGSEGDSIFEMWAGAYGDTKVLVRAGSFEDAFEALVEWLDDNAPGYLMWADYETAAQSLGYARAIDVPESEYHKLDEIAESDLTMIGHTQLNNGNAIPSWEWGGSEVEL